MANFYSVRFVLFARFNPFAHRGVAHDLIDRSVTGQNVYGMYAAILSILWRTWCSSRIHRDYWSEIAARAMWLLPRRSWLLYRRGFAPVEWSSVDVIRAAQTTAANELHDLLRPTRYCFPNEACSICFVQDITPAQRGCLITRIKRADQI